MRNKSYSRQPLQIINHNIIISKSNIWGSKLSHSHKKTRSSSSLNMTQTKKSLQSCITETQTKSVCQEDVQKTIKRAKKIVLKKGAKNLGINESNSNQQQTFVNNLSHSFLKSPKSQIDLTFRSSNGESLQNSMVIDQQKIKQNNIQINNLCLVQEFDRRRSKVYRLLCELDSKFKQIANVQFRRMDILEQLSEDFCRNCTITDDNRSKNGCMSLEIIETQGKDNVNIQTSEFKLDSFYTTL